MTTMQLPKSGMSKSEVLSALDRMRENDAKWRQGRTFSLVYWAGDDVLELLQDAFFQYFSENALNPMAFPSLRRFETEVVAMAGALLGHEDAAGTMTSGGTESILMAVKTARDWAREPSRTCTEPEMIVPEHRAPRVREGRRTTSACASIHAPVDASTCAPTWTR